MKIKSCKIKAFGNITDKTFDFSGNIDCQVQNNGVGKTTLADFVRVMLYGMETTKSNDKTMGDRSRYLPYESKKDYGGSLTIEVEGQEIVISRTFDKKSAPNDTLTINGEAITENKQTIGERYFNIDEDAFRRTVYMSSLTNNAEAVQGTDSINRNMDQMVTNIATVDLDTVYKSFDDKCNEIQTNSRARKNIGKINLLEEEENQINAKLEELRNIDDNLSVKYSNLNRLKGEEESLGNKIDEQQKVATALAFWQQIDNLQSNIDKGNEALNVLKNRYPKGLVTKEDNDTLKNANDQIGRAESALEAMKESEVDKKNFEALQKLFANGFDRDEYERIKGVNKRINEDLIRMQTESQTPLKGEEYAQKFANMVPSELEMEESRRKAQCFKDNESALQSLATMSGNAPMPVMWIVAGIVGVVAGIALIALGQMPVGIAVAGIAVMGVALALILSRQNGKNASQARAIQLAEMNSRLESELKRFYAPYGFYETSFLDYADTLKGMVEAYNDYKVNRENREREMKARMAAVENGKNEVSAYLSNYGVNELSQIETGYSIFEKLKSTREANQTKRNEYNAVIKANRETLESIFGKYGLQYPENVNTAVQQHDSDLYSWDTITASAKDLEENILAIKSANNLTVRPEAPKEGEDTDALKAEHENKVREVGRLMDDITADEKQLEDTGELKARLDAIKDEKKVLSERLSLLKKTKAYIEAADKALKDKYIGPVRERYSVYMRDLLPQLADNIEMDTDYRIKLKVDNETHECDHLSQGERTCLEMALRIAVIDNMYKDEKPFLVMDDPFVELDKDNMQKARELVKKIAEKYQVLYFCCHESRAI